MLRGEKDKPKINKNGNLIRIKSSVFLCSQAYNILLYPGCGLENKT